MRRPNLNETIVQVISENPPPESLNNITIEDIKQIVSLCEEYKFVKANRTEFAMNLTSKIKEIINR